MESPYSARFPFSPTGRDNPANARRPGGCGGTDLTTPHQTPDTSLQGPTTRPETMTEPTDHAEEPGAQGFQHAPVMVDEIVGLFAPVPEGWVVDATLGGGGHAAALLAAHSQLRVLGLDQDPAALVAATERLAPHGARSRLVRARFDRLAEVADAEGAVPVVGVLFDLGVSSPQFDHADRGFSYRAPGPLDMRMDPAGTLTADDIVNRWSVDELAGLLRRNSDERYAGRIAAAIVAHRPLHSTTELAEVVRAAIPAATRRRGGHPAKRTFQALRIAVNAELDILGPSLDSAIGVLAPGGRIAVLSYHSGEDRIVKNHLRRAASGGCTCPPGLPCGCGAEPTVRLLRAGGWTPTEAEVARNPRAASARLRAAERLGSTEVAA